MDDSLTNNLQQQYAALPPEVQAAISAADLPEKLQQIVKNQKLLIDQAGKLENEITVVLFGLEPLENFTGNIMRELSIPKDKALLIAHDVDDLIFKNIRDSLKNFAEAAIEAENEAIKNPGTPNKADILSGIENPTQIKTSENSISMSALTSNTAPMKSVEVKTNGVEIRPNMLPEINPEAVLPVKPIIPLHENISPVENIVATKMTETVAVPKQTIVIEEKTKLPEKPKSTADAYREPIN